MALFGVSRAFVGLKLRASGLIDPAPGNDAAAAAKPEARQTPGHQD
jgi:hypothetical protein